MPNTVVKPLYAESTRVETLREDRELPVRKKPRNESCGAFALCSHELKDGRTGQYFACPAHFGRGLRFLAGAPGGIALRPLVRPYGDTEYNRLSAAAP